MSRIQIAVPVIAAAACLLAACMEQAPDSGGVPQSGQALDAAPAVESAPAAVSRPNVLLIISDDVGFDVTTGMYPGMIGNLVAAYGPSGRGHPDWEKIDGHPASTPTLDRLARDGMVFTNVWAHPFCSPTRAAILTGSFGATTGVLSYADPLDQSQPSFVRSLRDSGYRTGLFGKWHLAGLPGQDVSYPGMKPLEAGFEIFRGNLHAAIGTFWEYDYQVQDAATAAGEWRNESPPERALPGIAATTYAPVVKAADTLAWIRAREAEDSGQPWFAWLAFNLSHATIQRAPSQMAVPNADTLDAVSLAEMQACGAVFQTQDTGSCSGEAVMRAMTNSLDTVMGKVLDAVDAIDPNTYVIYVGDNGTPMYGRPGLDFIDNMYITRTGRGKGTAYESGARVAMAIRGPRVAAGASSDDYLHVADIHSTVLELAGLPGNAAVHAAAAAPDRLDGISLAPIVFDGARAVRDPDTGYILTESLNLMTGGTEQVGARNGRYKVVCTGSTAAAGCEFYDLLADPLEEYPLRPPAACGAATTPPRADPGWHFCHLQGVVAGRSFMAPGARQ